MIRLEGSTCPNKCSGEWFAVEKSHPIRKFKTNLRGLSREQRLTSRVVPEPGSSAKRKESELDEKYGLTNHPEWLPELVREYKLKNPLS